MVFLRLLLLVPSLLLAVGANRPSTPGGLPALVFVSRQPLPDPAAGLPGLGPSHRTAVTGGRLMVRGVDGRVAPLLPEGVFADVADPDVSWDGRRIVFAAVESSDGPWRIWTVGSDGSGLAPATTSDRRLDLASLGGSAGRFERYDDFDPCWLPDGRVCFASTRYPQVSEQGGLEASNLFVVDLASGRVTRITSERNGAESPSVDPTTGRIVYGRWWFNRFLASEADPSGVTLERSLALPADEVNLWQAISVTPSGDGGRLAGGHPIRRAETMAYQPVVLADGTLLGVAAENLSLVPSPGRLRLQAFPGRFGAPRPIPAGGGAACAPAALPDGRVLFSHDPTGSGDFGLWVARRDGSRAAEVIDLPGTLELDAAPLAKRPVPPVIDDRLAELPRALPAARESELHDGITTFRFDCLNVFANAGVDVPIPDAPPLQRGLKIRFYATLSRPAAQGGDTVVLVRESPVDASGAVHEHDLPADTPMFEQLVDAHGRVLRSAMGPAHVPGFNAGRFGYGTKCVGCHVGHSAIPVASSAREGKRFNVSPSAEVTVSSEAEGGSGRKAADRRAKGPAREVAWVASGTDGERLRLTWRWPVEVDTLVIYAISPHVPDGTDLRIHELDLTFLRGGVVVRHESLRNGLLPAGTRVACQGVRVDAIELRPTRSTGRVHHRAAVGLAEVETLARLIED